jgi:Putative quorum-sensing-regulated virulence factor
VTEKRKKGVPVTGFCPSVDRAKHVMPFGKHRGRRLHEIPTNYLLWARDTLTRLSTGLRQAIQEEIEVRQYADADPAEEGDATEAEDMDCQHAAPARATRCGTIDKDDVLPMAVGWLAAMTEKADQQGKIKVKVAYAALLQEFGLDKYRPVNAYAPVQEIEK